MLFCAAAWPQSAVGWCSAFTWRLDPLRLSADLYVFATCLKKKKRKNSRRRQTTSRKMYAFEKIFLESLALQRQRVLRNLTLISGFMYSCKNVNYFLYFVPIECWNAALLSLKWLLDALLAFSGWICSTHFHKIMPGSLFTGALLSLQSSDRLFFSIISFKNLN